MAQVLKELKDEIALPLTISFKKSLETGTILNEWRDMEVMPIFKKEKKMDPGNYWPVLLTSIVGKMLERIVMEQTIQFFIAIS